MLERVGVELRSLRWDGTYYFHGTRTLDVDQFRTQGILPLWQVRTLCVMSSQLRSGSKSGGALSQAAETTVATSTG
jgi:hypothetical protein